MLRLGQGKETGECIGSVICKGDSHELINEQTLGMKYCPGWGIDLPKYRFVPYKPRTSRQPDNNFGFGLDINIQEDQEDFDIINMEPSLEPVCHEESVVGRGVIRRTPTIMVVRLYRHLTLLPYPKMEWRRGRNFGCLVQKGTLN